MKTENRKTGMEISKEDLEKITKEVKETLAFGYNHNRTFSSAELWNIQRRRKNILLRRHYS